MRKSYAITTLSASLVFALSSMSQPRDSSLFDCMKWRMIGPFRGGRTVGAAGVLQKPGTFYIGVNNGGIWKTDDFGRTWNPVFDAESTGSIGDIAVAPSNPEIIYAGTGEGIQRPDLSIGNGIYKSNDGGKSWTHLGLREGQQIGGVAVDPANENRVFAAVLGHPYGPNAERGVYRSVDGGHTWSRVLFKDDNTGAEEVAIDPKDPKIIYADMWAARQGPWENGAFKGEGSGLFKSTDGGDTWRQLTNGLPTAKQGLGRVGFCIAASDPRRLYATVDADTLGGIYRSDDGGESWTRVQSDSRLWGRGDDFAEIKADPLNPDVLYALDVVTWKSKDAGKTWEAFRGAPGGDDYHRIWIDPLNPKVILIASDQGAIVSTNGGETFSSWYNQPTAQFYHVIADNAFPYNVYGGQQESGSVGIASRGNDGEITYREWHPVGVEEYGYVAPDPLDPNIIYGGKISRYDKRTGQTQSVSPEPVRSGKYRFLRTAPVLFSPTNPRVLFLAGNVIFKTRDGGDHWEVISPDLSRETWDIPASVGIYATDQLKHMPQRGVIYSIAPSPLDSNLIWAGTDDGLIHLTQDGGKNWKNVTPPVITSWSKISIIEASHFDSHSAYAAVNRIRCDDMRPHIYRTADDGKTWKEIVFGLDEDPVNSVKEDPKTKGLLFAGSENLTWVSFDDGDHWQRLRLNMPATSIRDLYIKEDDLIAGTHGRGFWILDDIAPLRQIAAMHQHTTAATLFKPQKAYRIRWDTYTDTPVPQEEPAGQNPPDGAIIDYYLPEKSKSAVTLEIHDSKGNLVRKYSSADKPYEIPPLNIPTYWIRPQQILSAEKGSHRFIWDLHYPPLSLPPSYPIGAIYQNTAPSPTSPWVMPGAYAVTLTSDGKSYSEMLTVIMDPRVKTSTEDLQRQHDLSLRCYEARKLIEEVEREISAMRKKLGDEMKAAGGADSLQVKYRELATLQGSGRRGGGGGGFGQVNAAFAAIFNTLQESDVAPGAATIFALADTEKHLTELNEKWKSLR